MGRRELRFGGVKQVVIDYGHATAAVAVAIGLRMLADPFLAELKPAALLYAAVAYAIWRIGLGPAIYAAVIGFFLTDWMIASRTGAGFMRPEVVIAFPLYLVACTMIIAFGESLRRANTALAAEARRASESLAKLQSQDRHLRLALEAGRMGSWSWDLVSGKVHWSADLEEMHGHAPGTFAGTKEAFLEDIHPEDRQRVIETIESELAKGDAHFVEYRLAPKDGVVRWVEGRGAIERDVYGRPIRLVGICTDVTARKESEHATTKRALEVGALYELSELLQRALTTEEVYDCALDAILDALTCDRASLLLFDEMGIMRFMQWRGLSGPYRKAVEGHSPWNVDDHAARPICIADVAKSNLDAALKETVTREGIAALAFIPIVIGTRLLGKFMVYYDQPHVMDEDEIELATTIAHQVAFAIERRAAETRRDEATAALRASEERFVRFMHHLPGLAWIKDAEGRYVFANDRALQVFGKSEEELLGQTDWEVFPKEVAELFVHNDRQAAESETGVQVIEALEQEDGVHHSLVSKFPIPASSGGGRLVGGVAIDVTDRMRAEQALVEADRRKDEFLATLAHELRNPLAPLRSGLEFVSEGSAPADAVATAHQIMVRQVDYLSRLVGDLLDVSRIKRGEFLLQLQVHDIRLMLTSAADMARPSMAEVGQHFELSLPNEPVPVSCDFHRMTQVFGNLLFNAFKFTPDGGHISLRAKRVGNDAVIEVEDDGSGMTPEDVERVFDLFAQAPNRNSERRPVGLGVGLALAKDIVERHGGRLAVKSQGLGKGCVFTVTMPVALGQELTARDDPIVEMAAIPERRILVVDDNRDAADTIAMLLTADGHQVETAYSGRCALDRIGEWRPDLVLLDLGMPEMSGFEVVAELRRGPGGAGLQVVALTGWGQDDDVAKTRDAGFDAHIVKPVSLSKLRELLSSPKLTSRA